MPLRNQQAKAHVFLDVGMEECTKATLDSEVRAGAGTKTVITIGPACQDVDVLEKLLAAGVTCARINLSCGTKEYHELSLRNLQEAMKRTRRLCCVFLDTCGREVQIRRPLQHDEHGWPLLAGNPVAVKAGQTVVITTDPAAACTDSVFPIDHKDFPSVVNPGYQLQIGRFLATGADGGSTFLDVTAVTATTVTCTACNDALLDGSLHVIICHREDEDFRADFDLPLFSEADAEGLKYLGSRFELDYVDLSYCNREEDLYTARAYLDSLGMSQTKIIAKIERKSAVRNFEGIARVADGIVISRGNLGLDFEPEAMAMLQKRIISRCNKLGKPVLMTRFVDTMVHTPRPTRAEATDVANAVLDGVDGILLGAETLRGGYPLETVETVLKLCHAAEQHFDYRTHHEMLMGEAYEEEVSLQWTNRSVSDFGLLRSRSDQLAPDSGAPSLRGGSTAGPEHSVHTIHRHRSMKLLADTDDEGTAAAAAAAAAAGPASPDSPWGGVGSPAAALQPMPYVSEFGSLLPRAVGSSDHLDKTLLTHAPYMTKLESLASSATRVAEKIAAGLIIVMVQSGRTVSLVAKYRPPMPIMAVVVPKLKSSRLGWQLEGKYLARQTCVLRGVVPMLAAPMSEGSDDLINDAVCAAYLQRLVKPHQFVVVMKSVRGNMMVKVVQVNHDGTGIRVMSGLNSGGDSEAPDIICAASPFGAFIMPSAPSGPVLLTSPTARDAAAAALPAGASRRTVIVGKPAGGLLSTLSEAYDRKSS